MEVTAVQSERGIEEQQLNDELKAPQKVLRRSEAN